MFNFFKSSVSSVSRALTSTVKFCVNFLNSHPEIIQMLMFSALSEAAEAMLRYDSTANYCGCMSGQYNGTDPKKFQGYWLEPVSMCLQTLKTGMFYNASHSTVYTREPTSFCYEPPLGARHGTSVAPRIFEDDLLAICYNNNYRSFR